MAQGSPDPKEVGRYFAIAAVGLEMVVPIAVGMALDNYLSWKPWGTLGGAVLGLAGGLTHLVLLGRNDSSGPRRDAK
jgi:hypothetical protein